MNKEIKFLLKVLRNGLILAGLYFISVFSTQQAVSWIWLKPIILFLGTYILTELVKRYGIDLKVHKRKFKKSLTLLY